MASASESADVHRLARLQAGVVTRRQLVALGFTAAHARAAVLAGRWRRLAPGLYLTNNAAVEPASRIWAAVLGAGEGAAAGPACTLWLQGVVSVEPAVVEVWVPQERHVRGMPGTRLRRRRHLDADVHPAARPPQLRLERAVIAGAGSAPRDEAAVDLLIRAVQRRRTTAARLLAELARDRAHPRRVLVEDVLSDVQDGVRSQLERRWVRRVERPHGLPRGVLNAVDHDGRAQRYRDLHYEEWGVVCELDGTEAHPREEDFRDRARDNLVTVSGRVTLRYGWREVAGDPCRVAAEVATVLRCRGWRGRPLPCSPACPVRSWGGSDE